MTDSPEQGAGDHRDAAEIVASRADRLASPHGREQQGRREALLPAVDGIILLLMKILRRLLQIG